MVETGGRPIGPIDPQMPQQVLHQHPDDLSVRVVCRVKQSSSLEIIQDELADFAAELLVHRHQAPLFEIVQPGEVDDAVDRQRAIGEQALFPIGDLLAQPREQPVVVEKSQVRPLAFIGLLVARPVVMVERPQRSEMQQWKFDDPDVVPNIGPKRIILPIPDVLYQQDIAAFQLGSAEPRAGFVAARQNDISHPGGHRTRPSAPALREPFGPGSCRRSELSFFAAKPGSSVTSPAGLLRRSRAG